MVLKHHLPLIGRKTERIVLTKNASEQTLLISNRDLTVNPAIKKIKEKFLLANIADEPRANNEERIKIMRTTTVVLRIVTRLRHLTSILTWAKPHVKIRITNPKVMSNHQRPFRLLSIMIANATFAMIPIIWQTLAHKKANISTRLNPSFKLTKAL